MNQKSDVALKPRTQVKPDEWQKLIPVPIEMYAFWSPNNQEWMPNSLGPCDDDVEHGQAHHFLQTRDHRAIALCGMCYQKTNKPIESSVAPAPKSYAAQVARQ